MRKRFQIVIEGTNEEQMYQFFEEIQNKYSLYDNCVFQETLEEDSIIEGDDRCVETGDLVCTRPKRAGEEPKEVEE